VPNAPAEVLLDVELPVPVEGVALAFAFAVVDSAFFAFGVSEFNTVGIE
jgi:hypothetical protein